MAQGMGVGDAICIKREVIATFFGEDKKATPTESQG
jgi:hypothetical protein